MLARDKAKPHFPPFADGLTFHAHSFADDVGRLFWHESQLYRGINATHSAFVARLFADGVIRDLVERGLLVETELTDFAVDRYPMVVRHRAVSFLSYPNEWCAAMLKNAALSIIDLVAELSLRGLTLKDAHPWNLLFDFTRPIYVDLGSIVPEDEAGWAAYDEFCRFVYYPLILMAHGQERIARLLISEYEGVTRPDLLALMRGSAPSRFIISKLFDCLAGKIGSFVSKAPAPDTLGFLKRVRRDLERIQLPPCDEGLADEGRIAETDDIAIKGSVSRILAELRPGSLLDLSRRGAWTSLLPASQGCAVVSVSKHPSRATAIYEAALDEKLPVLPLVMDFVKPTPSVGYESHYAIAATERLKCEMVVALGLADQLARENYFTPGLIAEGLSAFSKRWLVVDVAGPQREARGDYGWLNSHSFDELMHEFGERFSTVRTASLVNRQALLVCER